MGNLTWKRLSAREVLAVCAAQDDPLFRSSILITPFSQPRRRGAGLFSGSTDAKHKRGYKPPFLEGPSAFTNVPSPSYLHRLSIESNDEARGARALRSHAFAL